MTGRAHMGYTAASPLTGGQPENRPFGIDACSNKEGPCRKKTGCFWRALAGLLHDIGKFAQRADVKIASAFSKEDAGERGTHAILRSTVYRTVCPAIFAKEAVSGVLYHHRPDLQEVEIARIRLADQLAAGERRTGSEEQARLKRSAPDSRIVKCHPASRATLTEKTQISRANH